MVEAGGSGNDRDSSYRLEPELRRLRPTKREFPVGFRVLPCGGLLYSSLDFWEDSPNLKIRQKNVKTEVFTFSSLVKAAVVRGPRKFDGGNSDTCFSLRQLIFCCGQTNCVVHWQQLLIMFTILAFFLLGIERFLYGKFHESKVRSSMYSRKKYQKMENLHFVFLA